MVPAVAPRSDFPGKARRKPHGRIERTHRAAPGHGPGLLFLAINRKDFQRLPGAALLLCAHFLLFLGFVFTVAEGYLPYDIFNVLEHASNNLCILCLVAWIWRITSRRESPPCWDTESRS